MTEAVYVIQAIVGLLAAGIGSVSSYKLIEYRISRLESGLVDNEKEHKEFRTADQHKDCKNQTCNKIAEVKSLVIAHTQTLNQVKACINRHVDGCKEIE